MNKKLWLSEPEAHDFPAAVDYLELLMPLDEANVLVDKLKAATTQIKKAKDILRASRLPLLQKDNVEIVKNFKKIKKGEKLSPILLIRGKEGLIIADGYHRICASYYLDEDLEIPCRLI